MIKAKLSNNTLILGLSAMNIDRLKSGMPIKFDARPFGYAGEIAIIFGETEEHIAKDLLRVSGTRASDVKWYPDSDG
jgi:hypothetical protein